MNRHGKVGLGMVPVRPGYTGHRHDDELALIDMKGRVYDIDARRFLTPDPFIQAPLFSQNHNRYSYVWNSPATFIDPSGFNCQAENVERCRDGNGVGGLDWGTVKKAAAGSMGAAEAWLSR